MVQFSVIGEPYAPYVSKHRYWTGLLLFTRTVFYLVFALNVSGDPEVNLLAITTTVVCLLLLKGQLFLFEMFEVIPIPK